MLDDKKLKIITDPLQPLSGCYFWVLFLGENRRLVSVGFLQLVLPAKPLSSPRGLVAALGIFIFEVDLFNKFCWCLSLQTFLFFLGNKLTPGSCQHMRSL